MQFQHHKRSKFKDNKFDFKTDYSMKDTELLTFTLPEFESAAKFRRSSSAYHKNFKGDYGIEAYPSILVIMILQLT